MKPKGWRNESRRHSLASKGIKTAQKIPKMPRDEIYIDWENKELILPVQNSKVLSLSEQQDKVPKGYKYQFRFKTDLKDALNLYLKR